MYVDAIHDREKDLIRIAERENGVRVFKDVPAHYVFYYQHPQGTHRSIYGHSCKKVLHTSAKKFRGELARVSETSVIFESDVNPIFRCLSDNYLGKDSPQLHVGLFDIEVDFDPERGYAPPDDPFAPITAITIHLSHLDRLITLALAPPSISLAEAEVLCSGLDDTIIFDDERALLRAFLDVIDDVDVFSGWNSEGFDIPYMVNRVRKLLGDDETARFCLWDQRPREKEYIKFQKTFKTYELVGRVHLDYLLLYQKHNTQQLHSYRLDYVGEIEVGENKVPYEGTLDKLYRDDFRRFVEYNRQDVALLVKIDRKRRFIELANQIAHGNGVLLKTTMGSVALVEQAIINEMHAMGFIVPDRRREIKEDDEEERTPVVGAYVAQPKVGLTDEIACVDINSLYPSAIRALNMSPETIVGQVRMDATMALVQERIASGIPRAEAWEGLFSTVEVAKMHERDPDFIVTVDFESGESAEMSAAELHEFVFAEDSNLCITANGTLFATDREGIIPALLKKWYSERKSMQKKAAFFRELANGVEIDGALSAALEDR
jgi:DNA polymerase elongation subunit (family B)